MIEYITLKCVECGKTKKITMDEWAIQWELALKNPQQALQHYICAKCINKQLTETLSKYPLSKKDWSKIKRLMKDLEETDDVIGGVV